MLILGDMITLALITVIGFMSHGETGISFLPRMAAAFLPLCISWFLLSPWFGLFDPPVTSDLKGLWRVPLAFLLAAPLAGVLRGFLLGAAVLPVFVLILGATSALGMSIWRCLYYFLSRGSESS